MGLTRLRLLSLVLLAMAVNTGCRQHPLSEISTAAPTTFKTVRPSVSPNPQSPKPLAPTIRLQDLAVLPAGHSHSQAKTTPQLKPTPSITRTTVQPSVGGPQVPSPITQAKANIKPAQKQPSSTATPRTPKSKKKTIAFQSAPYQVLNEFRGQAFKVKGQQVFAQGNLPPVQLDVKASDLLSVLKSTRSYFQRSAQRDPNLQRIGLLGTAGVTLTDIVKTLDFMIAVLHEDISQGRTPRLQDPNFINQHFQVLKWQPFNPEKPEQQKLRITKYAVFTHTGSLTKTATHNFALYALPPGAKDQPFVKKYTKQDVLSGIYEPGGKAYGKVRPLIYLTREGLEDALLEGTVLVKLPNGQQGYFNVATSNKMSFIRGVPQRQQRRYWYFQQVRGINGYGPIAIKPGVTFAGDVINIGLGRIIVMDYGQGQNRQLKLGVLADTGGAFLPNLFQLDFLSGIFPSKAAFKQNARQLPSYAKTYILVKK